MENKEIKAHAKFIRLSPRKARLVIQNLRKMKVLDALAKLNLMPQKASKEVAKLLKSAMANAEHNFGISKNDLVIEELTVDQGPTFKRYKPRARGSADVMKRKTTHLNVILISATRKRVERKEEPKEEIKKAESIKKKIEKTPEKKQTEAHEKKLAKEKKEAEKKDKAEPKAKKETEKESLRPRGKMRKKKIQKKETFFGNVKNFLRRKGF